MTENRASMLFIHLVMGVILGAFPTFASGASVGGGSGVRGEGGSSAHLNGVLVNPLIGSSSYHIDFGSISCKSGFSVGADMDYSSVKIVEKASSSYDIYPVGWLGLGWVMDASKIVAEDDGKVDAANHRYYYHYGDGQISEIYRSGAYPYSYQVKKQPSWRILPTYRTDGGIPIIAGWTITRPDGSIYSYSGIKSVPHDGTTIGTVLPAQPGYNYYPEWALVESKDLNQCKINYTYDQYPVTMSGTNPVRTYVLEAYLKTVSTDNGTTITFNTAAKTTSEGFITPLDPTMAYDRSVKRYLSSILFSRNGTTLRTYTFHYSGGTNQIPHINSGINGYAKRLLVGITESTTNNWAWTFEYGSNDYPGALVSVCEPLTGKTTKFFNSFNSYSDGTSYALVPVVTRTEMWNGFLSNNMVYTNYVYDRMSSSYVSEVDILYFGQVTQNSGEGNIVTQFDVTDAANSFGTPKQTDYYNTAGTRIVSSRLSTYAIKAWPEGTTAQWYDPNLVKTTSTLDGVASVSGIATSSTTPGCGLNWKNGIPQISYALKGDTGLVTKTDFAYEVDNNTAGMTSAYMFSQPAGTKVYRVLGYGQATNQCDLTAGTILRATHTLWSNTSGVYRPKATYSWGSPDGANGLPTSTFYEFDIGQPTAHGWQLTGTMDKYDPYGNLVTASNAQGIPSTTIYGSTEWIPRATVANCDFDACGVFTCDYDLNTTVNYINYFDDFNGWIRGVIHRTGGVCALQSSKGHFGSKCIRVFDSYGPTKLLYVDPTKDYVFSAWVLPVAGNGGVPCFGVRVFKNNAQRSLTIYSTVAPTAGQWKRIEYIVPKSLFTGLVKGQVGDVVQVWVGNDDTPNRPAIIPDFYVDDIRFYPSGAMVTTSYYDPLWLQPSITVDQAHTPSLWNQYDSRGRLFRTSKIDRTKGTTDAGFATTTMSEKTFREVGKDLRLVKPASNSGIAGGKPYPIVWAWGDFAFGTKAVKLEYQSGGTWNVITASTSAANSYSWTVPVLNQVVNIRATSVDNPSLTATTSAITILSYLQVTAPTIASQWTRGTAYNITWRTTGGSAANVKLEYSTNGGGSWTTILASTPNDGSQSWTVPTSATRSTKCKLRISEVVTNPKVVMSNGYFTIK